VATQRGTEQVHPQNVPPILHVRLPQGAEPLRPTAGVVHQKIHGAELLHSPSHHTLNISMVGDIAYDSDRPASFGLDRRHDLVELIAAARGHSHCHALSGKREGDARANASSCACDDPDLTRQLHASP